MRKRFSVWSTFGFVLVLLAAAARPVAAQAAPEESGYEPYAADQLDNLVAPIALYPDPLLAQVLIAATFPDQIDAAARWVRSNGQSGVDEQPWDVSVRSVAHYPTVLNMMAADLDWTTAVGQAYAYQSTDVMTSVQRLRAMARAQGNLPTTPQQQVVVEGGFISIWPASATLLYIPTYDPAIVFFRPVYFGGIFTAFSFGTAWRIGVWLNLDCDWGRHRVYYTAWQGRGWIARSRPQVRINATYVNTRLATITINRRVVQRPLNYAALSRYRSVHRSSDFASRARPANAPARPPQQIRAPNRIIDRNIPANQRLEPFRGRVAAPPPARTAPRPPGAVPQRPRAAPAAPQRPQAAPARPQPASPQPRSSLAPTRPAPSASRPPNAFGRGDGVFDPRAASQRGRDSRAQMQRPAQTQGARQQPQPQQRQKPHNSRGQRR
jgi:hypothetical protein